MGKVTILLIAIVSALSTSVGKSRAEPQVSENAFTSQASATVAFAYPQLRRYGHVHRGETGIAVQAISPSLAAGLKLPGDWGVIVSDVAPGSPADAAGLKVQDIITGIDGRPVDNLPSLGTRLFMRRGGEKIKLSVLRGTEKL